MDEAWVRSIRRHCRSHDVPFFFKQWGGVRKKLTGRLLDGRTYDEFPEIQTALVPTPKRRRELLEHLSLA
jgi:protein gp37